MTSGIITLTTDFGLKDPFVGVMKGVILGRFPGAQIVDLTHDVPAHAPREAAFWVERGYRYFPRRTVHVAVVDPGVGTKRDVLAAEVAEHFFLAPDNGLLGPVLERGARSLRRVDVSRLGALDIGSPSATFHGRDVFAPIAAELAADRLQIESLGPPAGTVAPSLIPPPKELADRVEGVVVTVDRFGNLLTNIEEKLLRRFADPVVCIGSEVLSLLRTYGDARRGEFLALVDAFDVLEIARAEGSAAHGLGLSTGERVVVRERG